MSLQEKVGKLLESSLAFKEDAVGMTKLWNRVKDRMYSLDTRQLQMGLGDQVCTSQMSLNVIYVLHNVLANKRLCVINLAYYSELCVCLVCCRASPLISPTIAPPKTRSWHRSS